MIVGKKKKFKLANKLHEQDFWQVYQIFQYGKTQLNINLNQVCIGQFHNNCLSWLFSYHDITCVFSNFRSKIISNYFLKLTSYIHNKKSHCYEVTKTLNRPKESEKWSKLTCNYNATRAQAFITNHILFVITVIVRLELPEEPPLQWSTFLYSWLWFIREFIAIKSNENSRARKQNSWSVQCSMKMALPIISHLDNRANCTNFYQWFYNLSDRKSIINLCPFCPPVGHYG